MPVEGAPEQPWRQKDLVHVMEHRAIAMPLKPLSARPTILRPRSANNAADDDLSRPATARVEDNRRRVAGYTFPAPSGSPRPEVLAASDRSHSRRQPLSALETSQRRRVAGVAEQEELPSVADLLPPLAGVPFQPNAAGWFQQSPSASAAAPLWPEAGGLQRGEGEPPPQRPPSATSAAADIVSANVPERVAECWGCGGCSSGGAFVTQPGGSYADGASRPRSSSVSADVLGGPPASCQPCSAAGGPAEAAVGGGGGGSPPQHLHVGVGGMAASARNVSPDRERARESARRNGLPDHAAVEAVAEAVDERTAVLTKIFQERLAKQRGALEAIRESERRAHESEVRQLKAAFEERLTEAVEKVRAVHATNRDAVAILQMNKKLKLEAAKLKREVAAAVEAGRTAAAHERQRAEEGAALVEQLMTQLQEKEALLAAGAGGMSEEDREEMMKKERQRAQQAANKEKQRIEAAMAEERAKANERVTTLQEELQTTKMALADARDDAADKGSRLDKETKAHKKTSEAKEKLELQWKAEEDKRLRLRKLEKEVNEATKQISAALLQMKQFGTATDAHLKVDLECLCCLGPLIEPQVLVPCGHSICNKCSQGLDAAAAQSSSEYGAAKFCPLCAQLKAEGGASEQRDRRRHALEDEAEEATPCESFPNLMLDAVTTRLRAKRIDGQGLLNSVAGIFIDSGRPLPGLPAPQPPAAPP